MLSCTFSIQRGLRRCPDPQLQLSTFPTDHDPREHAETPGLVGFARGQGGIIGRIAQVLSWSCGGDPMIRLLDSEQHIEYSSSVLMQHVYAAHSCSSFT